MYGRSFEKLVDDVLTSLARSMFEIEVLSYPRNAKRRSIDIVASRGDQKLLLKVTYDIDDVHYKEARELHNIAYTLNIPSLIVGENYNRRSMEDMVLYERYGLPAITPETLESVLTGKEEILIYYKRGEFYVSIDRRRLRELREKKKLSLGDIALALGVTRKAIYEYERGKMDLNIDKAERLVELLGDDILKPIDIFKPPEKALGHDKLPNLLPEAIIIREACRKGYKATYAVSTVFDIALNTGKTKYTIIVEKKKEKLLTKLEESEKIERVVNVKRVAIVSSPSIRREIESMGVNVVSSIDELNGDNENKE